jgi:hypothetical protein
MSLAQIWKSTPEQIQGKSIQQILTFAGDGVVRDGNSTSLEFRELLSHVPSETLAEFANQCLDTPFKDSGLALQDIVNQVGHRLGFKVENGRYRGTTKSYEVGFDGLWRGSDGDAIVVEVKTTDTYRLSLDVVASYRKELVRSEQISETKSSILYIVGRSDTGDLEAQIRGSRHAWDIRLISVEWLLRLMKLKEELEDPKIIGKIRDILTPREYTRVDGIIELVFSTAEDVRKEDITEEEEQTGEIKPTEKKFTPVQFRADCIARISKKLGETLVKRSAAIFSTPNEKIGINCLISREYDKGSAKKYWFAFHPSQKSTLEEFEQAFVCFGCGSPDNILMVPCATFFQWLDVFNMTEEEDRFYWHIHIFRTPSGWSVHAKAENQNIDANSFLID